MWIMTNDMCLRINSIPKAMPWAKSSSALSGGIDGNRL